MLRVFAYLLLEDVKGEVSDVVSVIDKQSLVTVATASVTASSSSKPSSDVVVEGMAMFSYTSIFLRCQSFL